MNTLNKSDRGNLAPVRLQSYMESAGSSWISNMMGVMRNRWMMMAVGIWIMCSSGTSYMYSEYSGAIKNSLLYDQQTLDTLAFFKEVGESVGLVSGLLYDFMPTWAVFIVGAVQVSSGYGMAWLAVTSRVARPAVWQMSLYLFVGSNGQTFFITAVIVSLVKNFPMSRGTVIGLMKGCIGLSAAILTQIHHVLYGSNPSSVLLFLSWFPSLISLVFMFGVFPISAPTIGIDRKESPYFLLLSIVAVTLAAYLMGIIMVQNSVAFSVSASLCVCLVILFILLCPLGLVVASQLETLQQKSSTSEREPLLQVEGDEKTSIAAAESAPSLSDYGTFASNWRTGKSGDLQGRDDQSGNVSIVDTASSSRTESSVDGTRAEQDESEGDWGLSRLGHFPDRGNDHNLIQALATVDFWLLILIAGIGMGSGLTAMDNLGQIGASLGYPASKVTTFVSLVSIWNFLGRLGSGALSEICLHEMGVPRPVFLLFAHLSLAVGHIIMAWALPGSLYMGSVVIGLNFGAHWALVPATTSEIFGLRHFGTLLNAVTMASPVGSYFFSVRVAGYLYDTEAQKQNPHRIPSITLGRRLMTKITEKLFTPSGDQLSCTGTTCFRLTFLIMAGMCLFGCILCIILIVRTRKFYVDVMYYELHHQSKHSSATLALDDPENTDPRSENVRKSI